MLLCSSLGSLPDAGDISSQLYLSRRSLQRGGFRGWLWHRCFEAWLASRTSWLLWSRLSSGAVPKSSSAAAGAGPETWLVAQLWSGFARHCWSGSISETCRCWFPSAYPFDCWSGSSIHGIQRGQRTHWMGRKVFSKLPVWCLRANRPTWSLREIHAQALHSAPMSLASLAFRSGPRGSKIALLLVRPCGCCKHDFHTCSSTKRRTRSSLSIGSIRWIWGVSLEMCALFLPRCHVWNLHPSEATVGRLRVKSHSWKVCIHFGLWSGHSKVWPCGFVL